MSFLILLGLQRNALLLATCRYHLPYLLPVILSSLERKRLRSHGTY